MSAIRRAGAWMRAGRLSGALLFSAALTPAVRAHPPGVADADQPAAHEVEALREFVKRAIERRDARALRAVYADGFTHTHASGRVDGKDTRIVSLLAGDPVIETAPEQDLSYRVFGDRTIIVTGLSTLPPPAAGGVPVRVRWMAVYVKTSADWQIAASQATRLP